MKKDDYYIVMEDKIEKKKDLGQYFTVGDSWFKPQIGIFLSSLPNVDIIVDPFAGRGDLLHLLEKNLCELSTWEDKGL